MKIEIAQLFVSAHGSVAVEDFAARTEQIANPLSLVANFERTSGKTGQK